MMNSHAKDSTECERRYKRILQCRQGRKGGSVIYYTSVSWKIYTTSFLFLVSFSSVCFMAFGFVVVHGVMVCRLHCVLMSVMWFCLEVRKLQVLWATVLDMGR